MKSESITWDGGVRRCMVGSLDRLRGQRASLCAFSSLSPWQKWVSAGTLGLQLQAGLQSQTDVSAPRECNVCACVRAWEAECVRVCMCVCFRIVKRLGINSTTKQHKHISRNEMFSKELYADGYSKTFKSFFFHSLLISHLPFPGSDVQSFSVLATLIGISGTSVWMN